MLAMCQALLVLFNFCNSPAGTYHYYFYHCHYSHDFPEEKIENPRGSVTFKAAFWLDMCCFVLSRVGEDAAECSYDRAAAWHQSLFLLSHFGFPDSGFPFWPHSAYKSHHRQNCGISGLRHLNNQLIKSLLLKTVEIASEVWSDFPKMQSKVVVSWFCSYCDGVCQLQFSTYICGDTVTVFTVLSSQFTSGSWPQHPRGVRYGEGLRCEK